ncbi:MAG: hydantoinase B/oxoprolinase family protein [Armatimonadetes bacterium]|nr:hydantoinase B/oxoprolinase family protein [Armatimonadota bacterium]
MDETRTAALRVDPVQLEVLRQRLLLIMEEAAHTVVRTAFSNAIREAWDFGCLLYDTRGRMVGQNTSVASKMGIALSALPEMLKKFPPDRLEPGDILITNDPWLTAGHLYDTVLMMPVFDGGRLIAYAEIMAHLSDIGGGLSTAARDVYEEGVFIPISRLVKAGRENDELFEFIEANVRVPEQTSGDLRSMIAALRLSHHKLIGFLRAHGLDSLDLLADEIVGRSEAAMRASIRQTLPEGRYAGELWLDGIDEPILIRVAVEVRDGEIVIDFTGSSPQSPWGINSVMNYTFVWTFVAVKCVVNPGLPNNYGTFKPVTITAPEGSILNPRKPAPVRMRSTVAHHLTAAVMGALVQAVPGRVIADSGSPMWVERFFGVDERGKPFAETIMLNGGMGARPTKDGPSTRSFPSNISNTPVEVFENILPLRVTEKRLVLDSGGPGRHRGGLGQQISFLAVHPVTALFQNEHIRYPARGFRGGGPGGLGVTLLNGEVIDSKSRVLLRPGDLATLRLPGGGGMFSPLERDPERVLADVRNGLVTREAAERDYGVAVTPEATAVDHQKTAELRAAGRK